MSKTALIDGDIYAYRYAFSNQETFNWGDGVMSESADQKMAQFQIQTEINAICSELKIDHVIVSLSSATNFRKKLNPKYKANRKKAIRPKLLHPIRSWFLTEFSCRMVKDLEADDVLGILQTGNMIKGKKIIISTDKDFLTVPGWIYNPRTKKKRLILPHEADANFYKQILTGDPVDNYHGIPGVGPKRAEKILGNLIDVPDRFDIWETIVKAYHAKGLTEADAIMTARMARILRDEDYDHETGEVRLWTPPFYIEEEPI